LEELQGLPKAVVGKVVKAVERLSETPYPPGVRKLVGMEHTFRMRVGDYRVVYDVFDDVLLIEIIRVKHRKDVYR
jgi:mRNA interferase RelE/StbE